MLKKIEKEEAGKFKENWVRIIEITIGYTWLMKSINNFFQELLQNNNNSRLSNI